jgi:hypothetical protein
LKQPSLLDGGGVDDRDGPNADVGDGSDDADLLMHAKPVVNGFPSDQTLINARMNRNNNNKALPQQMYDAILALKSPGTKHRRQQPPTKRHRKRHTSDVIVYRKDDLEGAAAADGGRGHVNETVDIVPLDSENRIRVNLTIASDDSIGSPVYTVSLSLPNAVQQPVEPELVGPVEPARTVVNRPQPAAPFPMGGTECECYCPCLDDDDQITADFSTSSPSTPLTSTEIGYNDSFTTVWNTYSSSSEQPETTEVLTCPPPVLLFCEPGKLLYPFCISGRGNSEEDNCQRPIFASQKSFRSLNLMYLPFFLIII